MGVGVGSHCPLIGRVFLLSCGEALHMQAGAETHLALPRLNLGKCSSLLWQMGGSFPHQAVDIFNIDSPVGTRGGERKTDIFNFQNMFSSPSLDHECEERCRIEHLP